MNTIARWANRHTPVAIALIIGLEITNSLIGLTIGAGVWATEMPAFSQSPVILHVLTALLLGAVMFIRQWYQLAEPATIRRQIRVKQLCTIALFALNFLLFGVLGGIWEQRSQVLHPSGGLGSYRSVGTVADSLKPNPASRQAYVRERTPVPVSARKDPALVWTRIGYAFLFLAGLMLAYFAGILACGLLCSEQAILAILAVLLGTGVLAGGVYFLFRALNPDLKLYREMTTVERRRERRRFGRSWLISIVALVALGLIGAL